MILTGENRNYSEINLSQFQLVYHKSYMDWTGIETVPPR